MTDVHDDTQEQKKRHRSPSYPTIGLREAVDRLRKFYAMDGKAGAPAAVAVKHMGFSTAHGSAYSALSALKKFGLVAEGNGRMVPTQRALEILNLPDGDARRTKALKDAALSPAIYLKLLEESPHGLPSDESLESELVTYKDFNPNAVKGFVKDLRDSLEFAGLSSGEALELPVEADNGEENKFQMFHIGDYVQWESNGELRLPEAKRVRGFSEDNKWAFLDGSTTGVPVNELIADVPPPTRQQDSPKSPLARPFKPPEQSEGMISTPVGKNEDGVVFAHVRFDSGIRKEYVVSLKKYLDYLESTLQDS